MIKIKEEKILPTLAVLSLALVLSLGVATKGSALVDLDSRTNMEVESSEEASLDLEVEEDLNISRVEVEENFEGSASVSHNSVENYESLKSYAVSSLRDDTRLSEMNFSKDQVEVKYKEQAKFLAFLPMTITVSARVHANGEVELDYPWYAFLTLDNEEKIANEMKVAVDTALRARLVGSVKAEGESANPSFNASQSALVAYEIERVLKANLKEETR